MYTKNALGNLKNRYIAVLKKCNLINAFGSLAIATLLATPSLSFANALITTTEPVLNNSDTLTGATESLSGRDYFVGMFGYNMMNNIDYVFTNFADGIISLSSTNAEVYGMYANARGNHILTNNGSITATSTNQLAYGMYAYGYGDHTLTNNSNIKVTAHNKAYGMYTLADGNHTLTNSGTITTTSTDNYAYGMFADGNGDYTLTNSGTITGISTNSTASGIQAYAESYEGNHKLTNTNSITVNAFNIAYGMSAYSNDNKMHMLTNSGTIQVTSSNSEAYGMRAYETNGSHTLTNSGTITTTAHDNAYGMHAYARNDGSHTLTNSGTLTITAHDNAYGIYAYASNDGSHTLTNNATIIASSKAVNAYGMRADGDGNHTLINNGEITVISEASYAYGMSGDDGYGHTLTNSGTITVTAQDTATGMRASASGAHTLINNGTLIVSSQDDDASAMRTFGNYGHEIVNNSIIKVTASDDAYGIQTSGDGTQVVTNNGIITSTTTGSNDKAYGIYVSTFGKNLINNTGIINLSALKGSAFEVYGVNSYTIGTYATTLRTWTANDAVFGIENSYNNVTFDNSTLILRPGTKAQGFEYGKEYKVTDMITIASTDTSPTAITGKIQNAVAEVPFLTANLNNSDIANPKVSLNANINADTVSPTVLAKLSVDKMHNKITKIASRKINKMIERRMAKNLKQVSEKAYEQGVIVAGDMLTSAPSYQENTWAIYLDAYAGYTGNSEYNFGTHTKGITFGGEKAISDKLSVGLALDFSDSATDGKDSLVADSKDITLAANADYFINPNWYVSGTMALSFGESDMDYMLSPSLYAKDDFNSQAYYLSLNTGYVYEINENNIIVPEVGLSYLNTQNDDIALDFASSDLYDLHINNESFSALYANLMLTWQGQYDTKLGVLRPSAGLGIRQNLTGSGIDSSVMLTGTSFDTVVTEDDTTFITNLGLEWQKGAFSMGISYEGGYGSEQTSHSGNVKFRYEF